jgi:hypothetical protein
LDAATFYTASDHKSQVFCLVKPLKWLNHTVQNSSGYNIKHTKITYQKQYTYILSSYVKIDRLLPRVFSMYTVTQCDSGYNLRIKLQCTHVHNIMHAEQCYSN